MPDSKVNNPPWWSMAVTALIGIFVFGIFLMLQPRDLIERMILGQNDFLQLYAGARLNGTPDLYDRKANERIHAEVASLQSDALSHHSRLPFYSFFLRPLSFLPYRTAYYTFEAISLVSFILFLWLFVPGCRSLVMYASLSVPLYVTLENGQDSTLVILFAGLSIYLVRKHFDFWAGFALSFCAIKFHLFFLIPLVVILKGRWRMLYGALTGGAVLIAISFLRAGLDWPRAYIEAMRDSDLHPSPELMPNLHTVSALLKGAPDIAAESILSILVIVAVIYLARTVKEFELVFAFAVVGSLLISFHSYTQDCLVLLLALAIMLTKSFSKGAKGLMELAVSPIPFFCLYFGVPFNLVMPALLLAVLGVAVAQARRTTTVAVQSI